MKPAHIFTILVLYIVLQFAWWTYLLLDLNQEVFLNKIELVKSHALETSQGNVQSSENALHAKANQRQWMIIGEGAVFISLLGWVSYRTLRAFKKEMELTRLQKNFLLSVTHEFKSPLASIKLYLQTLQKHKQLDEEKKDSFISKAIADTERLDVLVENTLLANRISRSDWSTDKFLNKEQINFSDLVTTVIEIFKALPEMKHDLQAAIEPGITLSGDKVALRLMLNNLVENAIKYSPPSSIINISLKIIKGSILFSVADAGTGIPDSEKKKVFEKFYRIGNEEVRKTKGTGLGLYLSKYIAEQHGGTIKVRDNTPKGSVFEVTLRK